jgi:hypothetical protein
MAWAEHLARELDKRKGHNGLQDDSRASEDEPRDGPSSRRHHPKFNSRHCANREGLRDRSRSIHQEISQIEYQGESFYRTPADNALASSMLIDQLMPHLPKDFEDVNTHVKRLLVMLDAATVADSVYSREDGNWGHEDDHR